RDGAWFSKYPPGFPLLLVPGVLIGAPWLVSPVAASLTLATLYLLGRSLFGGGTGLLAVVLLLTSPFFLFMSGSMMSHPACLLLTTLALLGIARAQRSDSGSVRARTAAVRGGWRVTGASTGRALPLPAAPGLLGRRPRGP